MFTIIQSPPLKGSTHVMASLAKAEGKVVYSNSPLLYDHNEVDFNTIDKVTNAVIALDYPQELLTKGPEISESKKNLMIAILQSETLKNVIYATTSGTYPFDNRIYRFCDYYIICRLANYGIVRFTLYNMRNKKDVKYYNLNILAADKLLPYFPVNGR